MTSRFRAPRDAASAAVPRLLTETQAAQAVGLELATFRAWVASGRLPGPIADCGKFDIKAIDAALDCISGLVGTTNALDTWRAKRRGARAGAS